MNTLPFKKNSPWLAPLAGWSDLVFRLLCREQGAAVCCTEMVSAKGLVYGGKNTKDLLQTTEDSSDSPLVVQIFGSESEFMAESIRILRSRGFEWFDVNLGCSVPKVTKTGSGAALMKDPKNLFNAARSVIKEAQPNHVGFKMRLGWNQSLENWKEIALTLEQEGAGWITLHPRYAVQGFSGVPQYQALAVLSEILTIPVIASGNIFNPYMAYCLLRSTNISAVMYARGALKNPSIFLQHKKIWDSISQVPTSHYDLSDLIANISNTPPDNNGGDIMAMKKLISRHAELAKQYSPEKALLKMRTFIPHYLKGVDGAKQIRQEICSCESWDQFEEIMTRFFSHIKGLNHDSSECSF